MWDVKIIDESKKILGLKWKGHVKKEEVQEVNKELEKLIKKIDATSFDLLVEMENIIAFPKETQEKVVEHQKWLLKNGMKRAAVVNNSATAKMQLERTAKESEHKNEFHFSSFEEALKFLQGP